MTRRLARPKTPEREEMRFANPRSDCETKWNLQPKRSKSQNYASNAALVTYATCEGLSFCAYYLSRVAKGC